jgi:hypothetical protein
VRRIVAPQPIDEPNRRDDDVRLRQEKRKRRALLWASELDGTTVDCGLERAEQAVVDAHPMTLLRVAATSRVADPDALG